MNNWMKIVSFAAIILVSVYIETSLAEAPKLKRNGSKLCFFCHEEERQMFNKRYVHYPIAQDNCNVCHNPHTAKYKFMLSEEIPKLCYSCHANEREEFSQAPYIHTAVRQGKCTECHDPHASDNDYLQKKIDGEICYSCHQQEKFEQGKIHPPVEAGKCLACHKPHTSTFKSQLLDSLEQLCFTCHDQQNFKRAHREYPVAKNGCLICHSRLSRNGTHSAHAPVVNRYNLANGLSLPYVHVSFVKNMCDSCHISSNSLEPLELRAKQIERCYHCHSNMEKMTNKFNALVQAKQKSRYVGDSDGSSSRKYRLTSAEVRKPK